MCIKPRASNPSSSPFVGARGVASCSSRSTGPATRTHEAAGLSLYRATRLGDLDPFEPNSDRALTMLRVGATHAGQVQRRFVLLLDRYGDRITIADPGGRALITMTSRTLDGAWKKGTSKGALWLGTLGCNLEGPNRA